MKNRKLQEFIEKLKREEQSGQTVQIVDAVIEQPQKVVGATTKRNEEQYIYEDKDKRTLSARCYKNSKGKWKRQICGSPIHYFNISENRLRRIDNTLERQSNRISENDFIGYENKYNSFKVRFAENIADSNIMRVEKNGYEMYLKLLDRNTDESSYTIHKNILASIIPNKKFDGLSSEIKYDEVYDNVDFEYELNSNKIKENITIKTRTNTYNFAFKIYTKGLRVVLNEKEIEFIATEASGGKETGDVVFTMPAAYMYDKNNITSSDIKYSLESVNVNEYILKVNPDKCWIDSQERVFPITIDPSIYIKEDDDMIYCLVSNYGRHSPGSDFYRDQLGYLPLGYFDGNASDSDAAKLFGETELYIGFKNADRLFNGNVNNATLEIPLLTQPAVTNSDGYFEVYGITDDPDWVNQGINWNKKPSTDNRILACTKPTEENDKWYLIFDITTAFNSAYTGFVVKASTRGIVFNGGWQNKVYVPNEAAKGQVLINVSYTEQEQIRGGKSIQQSCNQAGNGAIDLFTGDIAFAHEDLSLEGVQLPINISHIYNSKFYDKKSDTTYDCGSGWRLNFMQTLQLKSAPIGAFNDDPNFKCFEYTDASGNRQEITTRYYKMVTSDDGYRRFKIYGVYDKDRVDNRTVDWLSEVSNGTFVLTEEADSVYYVLTDQSGNKMRFYKSTGKLQSIQKAESSLYKISISYGSNKIELTDANGRTVTFVYAGNKLLRIHYNNEIIRSYTYQTINSISCLKTITGPSGTITFDYDDKGCLCKVTDPTGYIVEYKTTYDKKPKCIGYRVKSKNQKIAYNVNENAGAVACIAEKIGDDVTITYNSGINIEASERFNGFYSSNAIANMTKVENLAGASQYYSFHPDGSLITVFDDKLNQEVSYANVTTRALDAEKRWKSVEVTQMSASVLETTKVIESGTGGRNPFGYSSLTQKETKLLASFNNLETGCYVLTALISGNIVSGGAFEKLEEADKMPYVILKVARHIKIGNDDVQFVRVDQSLPVDATERIACLPFVFDENVSSVDLSVEVNKNPENISVTYWDVTCAAKATKIVAKDKDKSFTYSYNGKYVTESESDLCKRMSSSTKFSKVNRKGATSSVTSYVDYATSNSDIVNKEFDGIFLEQSYGYNNGNITRKEVTDKTTGQKMLTGFKYNHNDSKLTDNALCEETDENNNKTLYDYFPETGFIKRTTLPGTNQNIDYAYNGIEGLLKEIKAVGNSDNLVEESSNRLSYNKGYLTKLNHYGCDYNFTYDGFGRIVEVEIAGKTIIKANYTDNGNNIDGVEGATSKSATSYYTTTANNGLLCGQAICGQAIVSSYDNSGLSNSRACFCGDLFCGDTYCKQGYSGAYNLGRNNVYVSYYDKNGELIKVRHATNRELSDTFGAADDYITVTKTLSNDKYTVTYVIGTTKYEYNYNRITGELLDSTEYEGTTPKIKFANTEYDSFGRNSAIKFTIDNSKNLAYNYTYKSDYVDTVKSVTLPNGKTSTITTDGFGRLTNRTVNTTPVLQNIYSYSRNKDYSSYTTPLISKEILVAGNSSIGYQYTYDANNNITHIRDAANSLIASYQYDGLNRLIRENIVGGKTTVYKYDEGGNLQYKKRFDYSSAAGSLTKDLLNSTTGVKTTYEYDPRNKDKLLSCNGGMKLQYDDYGNPWLWFKHGTSSLPLYHLQWENVNQLSSIKDLGTNKIYTYKYNNQGIRTEKVVNGVTHKYYLNGEQIVAEKIGNNLVTYYYDTSGICGFNYNETDYYYVKNIFGDIIGIYDGSGECYATYSYDAWGKCSIATNVNNIATINPFRYRGYYFDTETNLYYLNSRYYDPEIGRFVSPDVINCIEPETIGGLNLYSYCENNPVMRIDSSGHAWYDVLAWIGVGLFAAALTVVTLGAAGIAIGGIVGGIVMGAAIGTLVLGTAGAAIGAVGGMIYDAANGNTFGTSIWTWTKAGFGIGAIAGAVIGGAIGGAAGASLYGANNLMLWTGLGKDGATIAAKEASKMGLKTIGQTFGGKVISMFPKAIANKMWIWASKLAVSTANMSSINLLTGTTIFAGSVYATYELPILIQRGIEIIRIIFGG